MVDEAGSFRYLKDPLSIPWLADYDPTCTGHRLTCAVKTPYGRYAIISTFTPAISMMGDLARREARSGYGPLLYRMAVVKITVHKIRQYQ